MSFSEQVPRRRVLDLQPALGGRPEIVQRPGGEEQQAAGGSGNAAGLYPVGHDGTHLAQREGGDWNLARLVVEIVEHRRDRTLLRGIYDICQVNIRWTVELWNFWNANESAVFFFFFFQFQAQFWNGISGWNSGPVDNDVGCHWLCWFFFCWFHRRLWWANWKNARSRLVRCRTAGRRWCCSIIRRPSASRLTWRRCRRSGTGCCSWRCAWRRTCATPASTTTSSPKCRSASSGASCNDFDWLWLTLLDVVDVVVV